MATIKQNQSPNSIKPIHHRVRTVFASIFGLIATLLIIISILAVWLNQTITNNSVFVSTLAPLSQKPAIQNFIVNKATTEIIQNNQGPGFETAILPASEVNGQSPAEVQSQLQSVVSKDVGSVVTSPEFSALWKSTIGSAQQQLVTGIKSTSGDVAINLHPAIVGVVDQFQAAVLRGSSNVINIPSNAGVITLSGAKLDSVRHVYNWFETATWLVVVIALLAIGLCVWLSVHHMRTFRRVFLVTGIIALVLAAVFYAPSLIISNSSSIAQKAAATVLSTLLHNLFLFCLIFGLVCVVASIGSKIYSKSSAKKKKTSTVRS